MWRTDWDNAPKEQKHFLVLKPDGLVTTAYYYWYTEDEIRRTISFWALQDAIKDEPMDDNGPPADCGLKWMDIPA